MINRDEKALKFVENYEITQIGITSEHDCSVESQTFDIIASFKLPKPEILAAGLTNTKDLDVCLSFECCYTEFGRRLLRMKRQEMIDFFKDVAINGLEPEDPCDCYKAEGETCMYCSGDDYKYRSNVLRMAYWNHHWDSNEPELWDIFISGKWFVIRD